MCVCLASFVLGALWFLSFLEVRLAIDILRTGFCVFVVSNFVSFSKFPNPDLSRPSSRPLRQDNEQVSNLEVSFD